MLVALRHRRGTAADLARLAACWLAAILLVQGLAAALTLVRGPAHGHAEAAWSRLDAMHLQAHATARAHHHDDLHALATPADGDALDTGALMLLLAAHAIRPDGPTWRSIDAGPDAQHAAIAWAVLVHDTPPPYRPPRA